MAPRVLGSRALNRALLARQFLLARTTRTPAQVIEHLVGLQAQNPPDPYVGLWTRIEGFVHDDLSRLLTTRRAVRLALQRSTIHLVTGRDCLALRPVLRDVQERNLFVGSPYGRKLKGLDLDAFLAAGRALFDERPRTTAAAGTLLAELFRGRDATSLGYGLRNLLTLVQIPPRGVWGASGQPVCATAETWLGRPLAKDAAPDALVLRYLTAFGPASVADAQNWSGLTRLAETFERLRKRLRTFRDENGRELFEVPRAPLPDGDVPAPVRFLPVYDNAVLGHADRARIVPPSVRSLATGGRSVGSVLVDGFVGGLWSVAREKSAAVLKVALVHRPVADDEAALVEEGARLLEFVAGTAGRRDVRLVRKL
ncbi:MAG: winged helix DNA-binding domain-containing protein [Vicinamibacteria bacterium]